MNSLSLNNKINSEGGTKIWAFIAVPITLFGLGNNFFFFFTIL